MSKLTLESTCSIESTPSVSSVADHESQDDSNSLEEIQSENSSSIETPPVVVIRRANKSYGSKKDANIVLQDLNMTINQGTMYVYNIH